MLEIGSFDSWDPPPTDQPMWILGKQYRAPWELEEYRAHVRSVLWLTYRKNFPPIGGDGPTSDQGWGCMLRCGQMLLAQTLLCRHLGRDWLWQPGCKDPTYLRILRMFDDKKSAVYSIHQIAQMGVTENKAVGEWFGPNTVAQVLRKLVVYDEWSNIRVHVAMDNTIVISDITSNYKPSSAGVPAGPSSSGDGQVNGYSNPSGAGSSFSNQWKPLLLVIPLRLGLEMNPAYIQSLKKCFTIKQSLGLIGGRPNHASYFIGYIGDELLYLDPHTTQPVYCLSCGDPECRRLADESYHTLSACRMPFLQLDPSIAVCFYCDSQAEFQDLCNCFRTMTAEEELPLFEICDERNWLLPESYKILDCSFNAEYSIIETERQYDTSDDEFEIL